MACIPHLSFKESFNAFIELTVLPVIDHFFCNLMIFLYHGAQLSIILLLSNKKTV